MQLRPFPNLPLMRVLSILTVFALVAGTDAFTVPSTKLGAANSVASVPLTQLAASQVAPSSSLKSSSGKLSEVGPTLDVEFFSWFNIRNSFFVCVFCHVFFPIPPPFLSQPFESIFVIMCNPIVGGDAGFLGILDVVCRIFLPPPYPLRPLTPLPYPPKTLPLPPTPIPPPQVPRGGVVSAFKNMDIPLITYFIFWYVGNYYYNISNKLALKAAGGKVRKMRMWEN